jgi:hypothetical protein
VKLVRSSAFRLAIGYVALFAVSAILLLAFVYWLATTYMVRQADETIEAEIVGLAERYRLGGLTGLPPRFASGSTAGPRALRSTFSPTPRERPSSGT